MSETNTAAFGVFPDRRSIETVVTSLKREGFQSSDISVLFRDSRGNWEFAAQKDSKSAAAAASGTSSAGAAHGALRWLAGISAIAIPGQGTFVAVGPIRSALEGTAFGSIHGALAGSLIGMGVPESEARRYEGRIVSSWFLLSVNCTDSQRLSKARQILSETRAEDVLATSMSESGFYSSDRSMAGGSSIPGAELARSHTS
jgi:hypothetical protein